MSKSGVPIILITHRAPDLRSTTLNQLHTLNLSSDMLYNTGEPAVWYYNERLCLYDNGIVWCSGTSKLNAFRQLAERVTLPKFNRIVCIDDKKGNLIDFLADDLNCDFLGLRYINQMTTLTY